ARGRRGGGVATRHGAQGRQEPDLLGQEHPEDHARDGDGRRRAPAPGRAAEAPGSVPSLLILNEHESEQTVALLLVTGDRGLAGAFNSQIVRAGVRAGTQFEHEGKSMAWYASGRRGVSSLVFRGREAKGAYTGFTDRPAYANAREIASDLMAAYIDGEVDRVEIVYNRYVSPLTQEVTLETLLPLQKATILQEGGGEEGGAGERAGGEADDTSGAADKRALVEYEP